MNRRPFGFYTQAAAIPYRIEGGEVEILLVTSRKNGRWIVPKGMIGLRASPGDTARREAFEEAGVLGEINSTPIGTYRNRKWGGEWTVAVYMMEVHTEVDRWPESSQRQRRWVEASLAAGMVDKKKLSRLILLVRDMVLGGNGPVRG
jgi:8-oxo-dGTP pyrophosphatase MutT (NUDIX family)